MVMTCTLAKLSESTARRTSVLVGVDGASSKDSTTTSLRGTGGGALATRPVPTTLGDPDVPFLFPSVRLGDTGKDEGGSFHGLQK